VNIQIHVFWAVTPCNNVAGYQLFRGSRCLHLQGEVYGSWIQIQVVVCALWHSVVMW